MPAPRRASRLPTLLLGVAAVALVAWVGEPHGLRFVDILGFSRRARELTAGKPASDGLYPLGFPALLALGHAAGFAVLPVARVLSGAAAVGLAWATDRRLGLGAAVWLLTQPVLLQWGSTEGTDLLAASLSLASVFAARRPVVAGLLLGAAIDVRWTAAAWLPALLIAAEGPGRLRALAAAVVGTLPHWAACAWSGALVLPDQSLNLSIAAGPGAPPQAAGLGAAVLRIPEGLVRAWPFVLPGLVERVAAGALALAVLLPARRGDVDGARDRRLAAAVAVGGLLHLTALAAVFANPRLALPATLAALVGPALLAARLGRFGGAVRGGAGIVLAALGLALLWPKLPGLREITPEEKRVVALREALAEAGADSSRTPVLSNSPLAHTEVDGWLVPSIHLGGLYVTPRTTPAELGRIADEHGLDTLVIDPTRGRRDYAGIVALFTAHDAALDGWTRASASSWRVWVRPRAGGSGPR